jgi:hypothetical protein
LYVRAYQRSLRLDPAAVDAWRLPVLVGRLTEGIEAERAAIFREINRLNVGA